MELVCRQAGHHPFCRSSQQAGQAEDPTPAQPQSSPPHPCADVLLHETAVSWIRQKLTATTPKKPWLETREQYAARLRQVVADINRSYAVGAFCQRFPDRLDELIRRQGDRLRS